MNRRRLLSTLPLVAGAALGLCSPGLWAQVPVDPHPEAVRTSLPIGPCPVCHTDPMVAITRLRSRDWVDKDFMPSNWDPNAIVTCPKCFYTRVWSDFTTPVSPEISDVILKGALKVPPHSEAKLPGWARCDLAAQTEALLTGRPVKVGLHYLHACWSVRWELPLFGTLIPNPPSSVPVARQKLRDFAKARTEANARFILTTLYKHGETDTLLANLAVLLPVASAGDVSSQLQDGLQIDRHFIQLALAQLKSAEGQPQTDMRFSDVHYLMGELHRRLGNYAAARTDYQTARDDADVQPTVAQWIDEQIALLP